MTYLNLTYILDSLGWALLHSLWQGALAFTFVFLFRLAARNAGPSLRYNVQFAALAGCLMAFLATFIIYLQASGRGNSVGSVLTQTLMFVENSAIALGAPPSETGTGGIIFDIGRYAPAIGLFWCLGFTLMAGRYAVAYGQTQTLRTKGLKDVPIYWANRFRTMVLNTGVSEKVKLYISDNVAGPLTIGFFRPVVLVPASFLTGLPQDQVEAILLHELAHIRRYDYAVNLLQTAIKTILFFHPAVHYISRRIDIDREQACDDLAVAQTRDPHALAKGLASLRLCRHQDFALAADDGQTPLLDRLQRLTGQSMATRRFEPAVMVTLTALLMGSALMASAPMADAHPVPDEKVEGKTYEHAKAAKHNYRFETAMIDNKPVTVKIMPSGTRWVKTDSGWYDLDNDPKARWALEEKSTALTYPPVAPTPPKAPTFPENCTDCFAKKMDQFQIDMEYFQADMERFAKAKAMSENRFDREDFEALMERAEDAREYALEQREDARERAQEQVEKAQEQREAAMERAHEQREEAMERAHEQREEAMERAHEQREEAMERAEEIREKAHRKADEKSRNNHEAFREELLDMLLEDGVIKSRSEFVSVTYPNGKVINGVNVDKKFGDRYCELWEKHNIPKSRQSSIMIKPYSYSIIHKDQSGTQSKRVTYGEWSQESDITAEAEAVRYADKYTKKTKSKAWKTPSFIMPVNSRHITSGYGRVEGHEFHDGLDIKAPRGTPVYASADGKVTLTTTEPKWGHRVMIKHDGDYKTLYAHMDSFVVNRGETVNSGDIIGYVGSTGISSGPHLHFEIRKGEKTINPEGYIF